MDIVLLIKSGIGLLVILAILVFFMINLPKGKQKKRVKVVVPTQKKVDTSLDYLRAVIRNKKSTTEELKEALEMILKYHGTIHPKLGLRAHKDFDMYMDVILHICRHPNTSKNLILNFDKGLRAKNPKYAVEINDALTKGLNSRGF